MTFLLLLSRSVTIITSVERSRIGTWSVSILIAISTLHRARWPHTIVCPSPMNCVVNGRNYYIVINLSTLPCHLLDYIAMTVCCTELKLLWMVEFTGVLSVHLIGFKWDRVWSNLPATELLTLDWSTGQLVEGATPGRQNGSNLI